jgi:hypothetical protein
MTGCPFLSRKSRGLVESDIRSGRAFRAILYIKGNPVSFIERLETFCIDSGMMNKHIRSTLLLNESKSFAVIKPFNNSISHNNILLSKYFQYFLNWRMQQKRGVILQKKITLYFQPGPC